MADETLYTMDMYIALKAAIAGGEEKVKYQDKEVTYRSLSQMKEILRDMEAELGLNQCRITRTRGVYVKG